MQALAASEAARASVADALLLAQRQAEAQGEEYAALERELSATARRGEEAQGHVAALLAAQEDMERMVERQALGVQALASQSET